MWNHYEKKIISSNENEIKLAIISMSTGLQIVYSEYILELKILKDKT